MKKKNNEPGVPFPFMEEYKQWVKEKKGIKRNYASNLKRLFSVLNKEFENYGNKRRLTSKPFNELLLDLFYKDKLKAFRLLEVQRQVAYSSKESQKKGVQDSTFGDCRAALERYYEFVAEKFMRNITDDELKLVNGYIDKYNKKTYSKKELFRNIITRRQTEGRYSGEVFYPIELIIKIFSEKNKNWLDDWFLKNVNKIYIRIGDSDKVERRQFHELNESNALDFNKDYTVTAYFKDCDAKGKTIYTKKDDKVVKLKVAILENIDVDHVVAISNLLNDSNDNEYTAIKQLTRLLKDDQGFVNAKDKKQYIRGDFYDNQKHSLQEYVEDLKDDLNNLLNKVEYEFMDGLANKRKSNK